MNGNPFEILCGVHPYVKEEKFSRVINHNYLIRFLDSLPDGEYLRTEIGRSAEGREIISVNFGSGALKVLMWSQMHGDEPTATLALIDMLNFFARNSDFEEIKREILSKLSVTVIPMLNPDGALKMTRTNALGIDINRDAKQLASPEAKTLYNALRNLKPDFAFNLHDQDIRWSAGSGNSPASISLLAPPPDYDKSVTPERERAIKLISQLFGYLNDSIPGCIAKYSDEHEPRSFGDLAAALGSSTVLIEAGREKFDEEKTNLRKLNFALFVSALHSIASGRFYNYDEGVYNSIPFNGKLYHDLIIRNAFINSNGKRYKVDLGIDRDYKFDEASRTEYLEGEISSIGDLSHTFGFEEFDAKGMQIETPDVFTGEVDDYNSSEIWNLITDNKLYVYNKSIGGKFTFKPINFLPNKSVVFKLLPGEYASFILNGSGKAYVINGYLIKNRDDLNKVKNGIIKSPYK